jgi:putative nucleotidyltransferase with HDIG domain
MLAAVLLTSSLAMHARLALGLGQALGLVLVSACGLMVLGAGASIVGTSGLVALVGTMAIIHRRHGTHTLRVGASLGALAAVAVMSSVIASGSTPIAAAFKDAAAAAGGAFGSVLLMLALEPVFDALFQHATRRTLTEWLSFEHPLLVELATKAPGTLQHSVNVGVLAASAAAAVGADALLARVGSLYHDVGKAAAPEYFVENQDGPNPHDALDPIASARTIRAHVPDGVDRVLAHRMSDRIVDFVREHHGTGTLRYQRAQAEERGLFDPADADVFRYPGPRPRSRETGIVMLADQIEATARSAPPVDTAACAEIVQRTIARVRDEGELDDSGLTVRDLSAIERALTRTLHSMYHRRLDYPHPRAGSARTSSARG